MTRFGLKALIPLVLLLSGCGINCELDHTGKPDENGDNVLSAKDGGHVPSKSLNSAIYIRFKCRPSG